MKKENPFYVGWQAGMSSELSSFLKKILIPLFILIPIITLVLVYAQQPFNDHIFEFGKVKEITGVYHATPVPILEAVPGTFQEEISNSILLVGFGKFGAEGIISEIEKSLGSIEGLKVTLQGTLIHGDGKAVFELTKKKNSLIKIHNNHKAPETTAETKIAVTYTGEILDPKCYFGVMKPGEGKIHKSCAIRCISGGIPPVFRTKQENGQHLYSILLGQNGEKINKQILNHIGEDVQIKGQSTTMHGWNVIYMNPVDIK